VPLQASPISPAAVKDHPMFSLETFRNEYETDTTPMTVRGRPFQFLAPKSIERFMDPEAVFENFPLWAKVWDASVVLADHLAGLRPQKDKRFLEIGCGLGIVGIVGSAFGHRFTMTEVNPDALNFAQANALLNGLTPGVDIQIGALDWNNPETEEVFDCIVGSEVVYKKGDYEPLMRLFQRHAKPTGEIILAEAFRKTSVEFLRRMEEGYELKARKKTLRSPDKEVSVILCEMTLR
jgi:predicted nicotinamide N-methyase